MKRFVFICLIFVSVGGLSQDVVDWKFSANKVSEMIYEIRLTATIDNSWHIYSQDSPKGGPLPTSINFVKNPLLVLQNKPVEKGKMEMYHDEVFDVDVYSYSNTVVFVQTVKLKRKVKTNITGEVEYMACTSRQCLPPKKLSFNLSLK